MPSAEFQHTLAKAASLSGTSLHTGAKVSLKIQPAPSNSGIKFKRKDLQDEPTIDATIANVKNGRARDDDRRGLDPRAHRRTRSFGARRARCR
jgi:hypothetical protein